MDRDKLKIQALLERISNITRDYEDRDSERRIDITVLTEEKNNLEAEVGRLSAELEQAQTITATVEE